MAGFFYACFFCVVTLWWFQGEEKVFFSNRLKA
ncbi:MAG: hypothetical protein FD170_286 [Bacteroidetes bacterium]|nr:MAG: hypothetical protein FD170_286 [Bacteroidota bacterium]